MLCHLPLSRPRSWYVCPRVTPNGLPAVLMWLYSFCFCCVMGGGGGVVSKKTRMKCVCREGWFRKLLSLFKMASPPPPLTGNKRPAPQLAKMPSLIAIYKVIAKLDNMLNSWWHQFSQFLSSCCIPFYHYPCEDSSFGGVSVLLFTVWTFLEVYFVLSTAYRLIWKDRTKSVKLSRPHPCSI